MTHNNYWLNRKARRPYSSISWQMLKLAFRQKLASKIGKTVAELGGMTLDDLLYDYGIEGLPVRPYQGQYIEIEDSMKYWMNKHCPIGNLLVDDEGNVLVDLAQGPNQ